MQITDRLQGLQGDLRLALWRELDILRGIGIPHHIISEHLTADSAAQLLTSLGF